MFELVIQREFCAAHAIVMNGRREPMHGHNWRVEVAVAADSLDDDGLVCDFHAIEAKLDAILQPLHNRDLNRVPPFDSVNPTAEQIARHIGESISASLQHGVRLVAASVTEAPGCKAVYRP